MNNIEFNKVLSTALKQFGFTYTNNAHYYSNDELIVVINTQKSNYDHSYYINYGFLIKELTPELKFPKETACDVRGCFGFKINNKIVYTFHLEESSVKQLEHAIVNEVTRIILPVCNGGLSKYFEIVPEAVATTTLKAKKYIGIL